MENAPELEADIPFCARESVLDVVRGSSRCAKAPPRSPSEEFRGITRLVESSRAGAGLHSTR